MQGKQNSLVTKKNDKQIQALNLDGILKYLKDSELESQQEKHPRKRYTQDVLDFFIEYVYMNNRTNLKEFMEELERTILIKTLAKFNGNQKDTAKFLGIKYTTLHEKVKKYNIHFRKEPVVKFYVTNIPES